jgi:hypothetical protein
MREAPIVDADFFRAPITVVVEDPATRAFIDGLWRDPKITLRVGASRAGVEAIAKGATRVAHRVVVGLVDLDFFTPHEDHWVDPSKSVLRLNRHEIENYLLDWGILAKIARCSEQELEQEAAAQARRLIWWMACKRVLHQFSRDLTEGFPSAPKVPPDAQAADQTAATSFIKDHPFWKKYRETQKSWQPRDIAVKVAQEGERYEQDCASGRWAETFSGKELLHHLRSFAALDHASQSTPAQRDEDLARRVAGEMYKSGKIPGDFRRLREALYQRAGMKT